MSNRFLCATLPQILKTRFLRLTQTFLILLICLFSLPPGIFAQGGFSGGGGSQGTDIQICGDNIDRRWAPGNGEGAPIFSDRFGNSYDRSQLMVPNVTGCDCSEFLGDPDIPNLATSYFQLTFQDVATGTNVGFASPTLGPAYRKVACKVFSDLAALIQPRQAACDLELPLQVNIEIAPSVTSGSTGYLAVGSPIFQRVEYGV